MSSLILIVDDNADILLNLKIILESNNYEVISAKNGKDAIKILGELNQLPELVISDIMMPEMNGYELFEAVSKHPRWSSVSFIFLSAYSPEKDVIISKKINQNDIIYKPFKEDELLKIIDEKIIMK